jgi:hypothetical protein
MLRKATSEYNIMAPGDYTEEYVNDEGVANDDAAGGGRKQGGGGDRVTDTEEHDADVDGNGDLGIDDEASDDESPIDELITFIPDLFGLFCFF